MLLTTYATLYAAEQTQISERIPDRVTDDLMLLKPMLSKNDDVQLNSPISKPSENESKLHSCEIGFNSLPITKMLFGSNALSVCFNSPK